MTTYDVLHSSSLPCNKVILVVLFTALFVSLACSVPTNEHGRTGQQIFASTCAECHGATAEGQPNWHISNEDGTIPAPPLNGSGHAWHHPDGLLYRIVSQGGTIQEDPLIPNFKSAMPAFGDQLSHEEIVEVITYVQSLWGDKTSRGLSIRDSQSRVSEDDPFPSDGG